MYKTKIVYLNFLQSSAYEGPESIDCNFGFLDLLNVSNVTNFTVARLLSTKSKSYLKIVFEL